MVREDSAPGLLPSLLDRLIDPEAGGTAWRRGYGPEQMLAAVRRDLEELLNTRQTHMGLPADFVEVHNSLIGYGLPDLTSLNAITPEQRQGLVQAIRDAVARFEPRLQEVRTALLTPEGTQDRHLRFRIEARLKADPAPQVAFETVLKLATGHYAVEATEP